MAVLVTLSFSLWLSANSCLHSALAQGSLNQDETGKLKLLEQNFFFKNYDDDSVETRLARIEKRVFGEAAEGSLSERMAHILQVAKPVERPAAGTNSNNGNNKGSATVNTPAARTPEQIQQDEQFKREDEADRARRRAMAARDEEVNQMSADAIRLWKEGRKPEAIEKFEQAVRLSPDSAEAHFSLGVAYEGMAKFGDALSSYKKALEIIPTKPEYREAVRLVEKKALSQGQDDGKKKELRQLAEEASGAYSRGEFISALDLYKQLDRKTPNQARIKFNIATIYLAMKNPVQALDFFRQAKKLNPDEPSYQKAVAQLEGNLQAEEIERTNAERAWQDQDNQQSGQQNNQQSGRNQRNSNQKSNNQQAYQQNSNQQYQQPNQQYQNQQYQQPNQQYANQQYQQPNQQFQNQQYQQPNQQYQQPNQQQQNSDQPNQKKQKKRSKSEDNNNNNNSGNGNAVFVNNNANSNGLLGGDKNAPPASSSFGILAKKSKEGVLVTTIGIASRAAKCGLQRGDTIRAVDGVVIQNDKHFQQLMGSKRPGQSIQLLIDRNGSIGQIVL